MAPRGMSKEEKRTKSKSRRPVLEIFHESADFFSFKEIEKIASKQKGIVLPTVKETLEEIKADGLVVSEKIGTGVYYWSFPSAAGAQKQAVVDRMTKEVADMDAKIAESASALHDAQQGREDTDERRNLLAVLAAEQAQMESLTAELAAFGAADPLMYDKKRQAVDVAKRAAARWTDNLWICVSALKNAGAEEDVIRAMLGLSDDWDNLDDIGN